MDKSYDGPSYEQRSQLADLLEKRLDEIGWTRKFKKSTKEIIVDKCDENEKLDIKKIIREIIPTAKESIPKDFIEDFKTRMSSVYGKKAAATPPPPPPPKQQPLTQRVAHTNPPIINQTILENVTMSMSP